tara:strand:+ start:301 stop:621 length:321 start_codon:yes stop_codon:yes gene_type:complete
MATKTNLERAKRSGVVFWVGYAAAIVLLILGRWYSSPGTPESGYSAADTFSLVGLFAVVAMGNSAIKQSVYLKREIADLKSGDSDTTSLTASTDPSAESSPTPEGD